MFNCSSCCIASFDCELFLPWLGGKAKKEEKEMNWAVLSTVMVAVHLVTEYAHYIIEFCWGKKDKDILKDILQHRKSSRKSEMLVEIVKDLRRIKKHLGIEEEKDEEKEE